MNHELMFYTNPRSRGAIVHLGWGLGFNTIPERQEFVSYWDRINKRPAYISAKQKDESLMASLKS